MADPSAVREAQSDSNASRCRRTARLTARRPLWRDSGEPLIERLDPANQNQLPQAPAAENRAEDTQWADLARLVRSAGDGVRVRRLGGTRTGEIRLTRLLRNPSVTPHGMAVTAAQRTAGRCVGRPVAAIQDTTVVRSEGGGGHYLRAMLALDAEDGAPIFRISPTSAPVLRGSGLIRAALM